MPIHQSYAIMLELSDNQVRSIYLGVYLDEKLDFNTDIKEKINRGNTGIGSIR